MAREVFLNVYQTRVGASAHQVTKYMFKKIALWHNASMTIKEGYEFWYAFPKTMGGKEAQSTVVTYAGHWLKTKPSASSLREQIYKGSDIDLNKFPF